MLTFHFENTYAEQLREFCVPSSPASVPDPVLLQFNKSLADELGLNVAELDTAWITRVFSGNELPASAQPVAQVYAGHQFGGFVPQLGDGRALLLGEVLDRRGERRDVAFKGSGQTPFARGGDGKAAVGPVLREYLMGEAMNALGIPTTRALAAVATGEQVRREIPLPGAVLTRVAASHIRVGTFQYFAARQQFDHVRKLADYVINRHDPNLAKESNRYLLLLEAVAERQAALVAQWMLVGFIHGVMNTDNMAISGETIDYGPCAFMESYSPQTVFSSIDSGGRYAYGNQPIIARWNLARLAETLLPLINKSEPSQAVADATEVLEGFMQRFDSFWLAGVRAKLGLQVASSDDEEDRKLAQDWLDLLGRHQVDFTQGWRRLADAADGNSKLIEDLFPSADVPQSWLDRWRLRIGQNPSSSIAESMRAVNPVYIPRNHLVEEALAVASDQTDLTMFDQLLGVLRQPYEEKSGFEDYARPASQDFTACYQTFCGT